MGQRGAELGDGLQRLAVVDRDGVEADGGAAGAVGEADDDPGAPNSTRTRMEVAPCVTAVEKVEVFSSARYCPAIWVTASRSDQSFCASS